MRVRKIKLLVAGVACSATIHAPAALSQSFLDQFYQDVVNSANVTAADIYRSGDSYTAFGGSIAMKAPTRQFRPLYFTPWNMRSSCGGIDIMLGGFSIPSRQEFVNFLRSVGQNLPGLAFQLALQTLSAQLESKVGEYKKMLMDFSAWSIDSCKAAQALFDHGKKWLLESSQETIGEQRAAGTCTDQAACMQTYETDPARVVNDCGPETLSDGTTVPNKCQSNLVWDLLRGDSTTVWLTRQIREEIMSLVGSVIFRAETVNGETTIVPTPLPPIQNMSVATLIDGGTVQVYACDEQVKCLNPSTTAITRISLAQTVRGIAGRYVDAVVNRVDRASNGLTNEEVVLLGGVASMPALSMLNAVASPMAASLRTAVIDAVSVAVAVEVAAASFETLLREAKKAASSKASNANRQQQAEYAEKLEQRIRHLQDELRNERSKALESLRRVADYILILDHLNRAWRSRMSAQLAANLNFGRR
ncbi:MAG TPA: conjugal transfer protein TraH [Burkholderiaceae bacterium]|nr:conjugal transfer protein TraH [Burkholderiaceae bacterium]